MFIRQKGAENSGDNATKGARKFSEMNGANYQKQAICEHEHTIHKPTSNTSYTEFDRFRAGTSERAFYHSHGHHSGEPVFDGSNINNWTENNTYNSEENRPRNVNFII